METTKGLKKRVKPLRAKANSLLQPDNYYMTFSVICEQTLSNIKKP